MTTSDLVKAYFSATTAAVGLALGLNRIIPHLPALKPAYKSLLSKFIPFVAVAGAGTVNVFLGAKSCPKAFTSIDQAKTRVKMRRTLARARKPLVVPYPRSRFREYSPTHLRSSCLPSRTLFSSNAFRRHSATDDGGHGADMLSIWV